MHHRIATVEALEALYGPPAERSVRKQSDHLNADGQAFVRASPFVVLASAGHDGLDRSPKGDPAGFVQILDARTLAVPDRPGNDRLDNLRNLLQDPRVSRLFLAPGIGESLRANGHAEIRVDPASLARFAIRGKPPRSMIVVHIDAAISTVPRRSCARPCGPGAAPAARTVAQCRHHARAPGRWRLRCRRLRSRVAKTHAGHAVLARRPRQPPGRRAV